jgi:hypothetical protein
LEKSKVL